MKIAAISDPHGQLPIIPKCDLLLVGGDICPVWNHDLDYQHRWLDTNFRWWLDFVSARKIVGVWGNHDWVGQLGSPPSDLPITILTDSSLEWEGLHIYGTPWQRRFYDWAFNLDEKELEEKHVLIPHCDILISHGPPLGYCDGNLGTESLTAAIMMEKIPLTICGHIHFAYGIDTIPFFGGDKGWVVNASLLNEKYQMVNKPLQIEWSLEQHKVIEIKS